MRVCVGELNVVRQERQFSYGSVICLPTGKMSSAYVRKVREGVVQTEVEASSAGESQRIWRY